jgi:hypothetical protein
MVAVIGVTARRRFGSDGTIFVAGSRGVIGGGRDPRSGNYRPARTRGFPRAHPR